MNTVIAVLSTIILAVTVLTLFLGIFAYIVYKARKRSAKYHGHPAKPKTDEKPEVSSPLPPPPAEPTTSLIQRYEPEKKKNDRIEWR